MIFPEFSKYVIPLFSGNSTCEYVLGVNMSFMSYSFEEFLVILDFLQSHLPYQSGYLFSLISLDTRSIFS